MSVSFAEYFDSIHQSDPDACHVCVENPCECRGALSSAWAESHTPDGPRFVAYVHGYDFTIAHQDGAWVWSAIGADTLTDSAATVEDAAEAAIAAVGEDLDVTRKGLEALR